MISMSQITQSQIIPAAAGCCFGFIAAAALMGPPFAPLPGRPVAANVKLDAYAHDGWYDANPRVCTPAPAAPTAPTKDGRQGYDAGFRTDPPH